MWNEFQVRSHMISPSLHRLSYPLLGSVMSDRFISYGSSSHGVLSPKSQHGGKVPTFEPRETLKKHGELPV